ncbi:MAG: exonuclease SbcCD subunit D [Zavarzinella sp.]
MRILHTADWHLGDRLGRQDRTADLRTAVEQVAKYCHQEQVDLLLVAGDLFSELARPDSLRDTIRHWGATFSDFLHQGGTIITLTGNHDNEVFCRTLAEAMELAAPEAVTADGVASRGRFYLATEPTFFRLSAPNEVQFLLMPYPTLKTYVPDGEKYSSTSAQEKYQKLMDAVVERMNQLRQSPHARPNLPMVLAAHLNVEGADIGNGLFRLSSEHDVVVKFDQLASDYTYIALGHIHKPQVLAGQEHIRYSGSIECLDLGEHNDQKSVVIVDIDENGLSTPPRVLPLQTRRVRRVLVDRPAVQLPQLMQQYPTGCNDLVRLEVHYHSGEDNLEQILKDLEVIFPHYYTREWSEKLDLGPVMPLSQEEIRTLSFQDTVRQYAMEQLLDQPESERNALLERLEQLLDQEATSS